MLEPGYPEVPPDFGYWLAGFIDGEGCFILSPNAHRSDWNIRFQLTLRDDDAAILDEIQAVTGLGHRKRRRYQKATQNRNGRPQTEWLVLSKPDQAQLIRLLDRYPLRAKKARDYVIWRQAVLHRLGMKRYGSRKSDWGPIPELAMMLRSTRKYESSGADVPLFPEAQPTLL